MNEEPTSKKEDEIFCKECGKKITDGSLYCNYCGIKIKLMEKDLSNNDITPQSTEEKASESQAEEEYTNRNKEPCPECNKLIKKDTLFCPYCGNQVKTLLVSGEIIKKSKCISVILAVFLGCWTWVYTWKKDWWKFTTSIVILLTLVFVIGGWVFLVGLVFSIWAIIDTSVKKDEFYENYPND